MLIMWIKYFIKVLWELIDKKLVLLKKYLILLLSVLDFNNFLFFLQILLNNFSEILMYNQNL